MTTRQVTDITGQTTLVECLGCAMQRGEIERPTTPILSTTHFDAHQDYEIPIPGFIIVASIRHLQSVDEFTDEEKLDFINSLVLVRQALRQVLNIQVVYFIQEEDTADHFHVWLFPRYDWMTQQFGKKIQSVRPIMEYARDTLKTPENLEKVVTASNQLKDYLAKNK